MLSYRVPVMTLYRLLAAYLLFVSAKSEERPGLEVYTQPKGRDFLLIPEFLPVDQVQNILEGSSIVLVCRVINLSMHHTVSWLRLSDTQVLTVGGFVFSSDPRVQVFVQTGAWHTSGTWTLRISPVILQDAGNYQCQVNTEPASVLDITVHVYQINNTEPTSTQEENKSADGLITDNQPPEIGDPPEEKEAEEVAQDDGEIDPTLEDGLLDGPGISNGGTTEGGPSLGADGGGGREPFPEKYTPATEPAEYPIAEKTKKAEAERRPFQGGEEDIHSSEDGSSSLLIPVVSLFAVISVILILGMIRTFYLKPKPEVDRVRSRTGTLESRKSNRSLESRKSSRSVDSRRSTRSTGSRSRRRGQGRDDGEEDSETEFRQIRKCSLLPPLIEVVEATPPVSSRLYVVQDPYGQPYSLTGFRPAPPQPRPSRHHQQSPPHPPLSREGSCSTKKSTKCSETSYESEYSDDFSDGSSVRTETSDPERGQFASVRRNKRYPKRTSLEAQRNGSQCFVGPTVSGIWKTPALASAETLYGGDGCVSPPPPPTRSTETLYGFLPLSTDANGHTPTSLAAPLQFPPRNTLERRKIHFNPFEEYSD